MIKDLREARDEVLDAARMGEDGCLDLEATCSNLGLDAAELADFAEELATAAGTPQFQKVNGSTLTLLSAAVAVRAKRVEDDPVVVDGGGWVDGLSLWDHMAALGYAFRFVGLAVLFALGVPMLLVLAIANL
jgi:hypothetical protein